MPLEVMVISMTNDQASNPKSQISNPKKEIVEIGDVQIILDKWNEILKVVRPFNHSVEGLLRSTKPIAFDGTTLTLEVFYKFHQDKLSEEKCRKIVEDGIATVLEAPKIILTFLLG